MRMDPVNGVIEVGNVLFSPSLQRTPAATEAMYLMARHIFEVLGYRRYEWKCNALNLPSQRAAKRLGFTYEGTFLQHMIIKGKNRDTAWYSMLDSEWPSRKAVFEAWLSPENFDASGQQKQTLATIPPLSV
jgi:RimJ/RimL family protein N-acetyltransferase